MIKTHATPVGDLLYLLFRDIDEADDIGVPTREVVAVVRAAEGAWWTSYANRKSAEFIESRRRLAESIAALRLTLEARRR